MPWANRTAIEKYRYIEDISPDITQAIWRAAREAHNEAEFESRVNELLRQAAQKLGVDLLVREQYTLATGRADAVYNRLVIEYEPPGSLRDRISHHHTRHAVEQLKRYIEGLAKRERHAKDRLLGVAFDGYYYIFVRYRDGHWYIEAPLEVNPSSTARFLRSLFSLSSGRALIPENLVEDFGTQNIYSQRVASALYDALEGHSEDLIGKLFQQWRLFSSEVSGYDEAAVRLRDKKELRAFVKGMGLKPEKVDPSRLLFVIHTYFSFLVKAIARLVLEQHAGGKLGTTPLTVLVGTDDETLHRELEQMESGGIFRALGLQNLLEGDFFAWYLHAWSPEVADALRLTLGRLAEYNPATIEDDPYAARDLLKKLYHYLLPRELRHDLGEYYTPDWLAERVLTQLGEPTFQMPEPGATKPQRRFEPKRLLDPACGSGTFLVLAIRALKENCLRQGLGEAETLEVILQNVVGIDLNPLAVLAARVNYLLAIADLVPYRRGPIEIPIYLADSILTPARGETLFDADRFVLNTAVGELAVPAMMNTRDDVEKLMNLLDEYVHASFSTEAFLTRARQFIQPMDPRTEAMLRELYERLLDLERKGLNGIWARVIKNAFMPLFLGKFDYIVGNPPWVNWESLPDGYRRQIAPLWREYALFPHKGFDAILGKSKDDISILMTYVVADRFLRDGGKLAFVITQSVFKSAGAGKGFRRFRIGETGPHLKVVHVDDLSDLQPFEGASNRTAVAVFQKGQPTQYPVPYTYWKKVAPGRLDYESTLDEVFSKVRRLNLFAVPVNADDPTSAWLTARRRALSIIRKILGPSDYQARKGVTASLNGVFWLEILTQRPDGLLVVRNLTEASKRKVEQVTTEIEPDLIYPLLRGREVRRWQVSRSASILITHLPGQRLKAIPEEQMQSSWPKTWKYLKRFEEDLRNSGVVKRYFPSGPFYSMFNIGDYTFMPYKVVFREISSAITSAVVEPVEGKSVIPDHKLVMCQSDNEYEAHFICAVLNSTIVEFVVKTFVIETQHSASILQNIRIPRYDRNHSLHNLLANLSMRAHNMATEAYAGNRKAKHELRRLEEEIDEAVAELWGVTAKELEEIQSSLEELGRTASQGADRESQEENEDA